MNILPDKIRVEFQLEECQRIQHRCQELHTRLEQQKIQLQRQQKMIKEQQEYWQQKMIEWRQEQQRIDQIKKASRWRINTTVIIQKDLLAYKL